MTYAQSSLYFDGTGEDVSVGKSVTNFQIGDRVIGNFFQAWKEGKIDDAGLNSAMGGSINGVLADYFILKADCSVKIPDYLAYAEAATLPNNCMAFTCLCW
ncbi:alcohol dehydrogenase catalytic domain-containing protein [Neptuniibacter marinus]|uniref:alcohol dehydrogenase catalytic domain-containing protein n=1 Tax=Neptuniibacter marinus TaxID=1806670 RepID=UPI00082D0768|nr:hypothetical protein [Neptuniibacter marinus]